MMPFYDVSTTAELEATAGVLAQVCDAAARANLEIMVVGAAARDILIGHVVGSPLQRATTDIDVAVSVASWSDVERLTAQLSRTADSVHRFAVRGVDVDIIPFGGIETDRRTITWPNDHSMDVLGFREAYAAAAQVKLPGDLVVAVASLPAQSVLKLIAWRDRRYESRRDAIDLKAILDAYHEGTYFDELYDGHVHLLEKHGFDPVLAGAERMGLEASSLLHPRYQTAITDLLDHETSRDALLADMGTMPGLGRSMLSAYREGFRR